MHNLEELLYRLVIVPLVAFLPAPLAYGVARLRGNWYYQLNASKREEIIHNLEGVFGNQMSQAERKQVARDYFRRRSCEAIDVMRLAGNGRALARLVKIQGLEHIEAAQAAGKGAIICSAHFGSYNSCFSLLGVRGFSVTGVGDWRSNSDPGLSPLQRFLWRLIQQIPLARHRRRPNIEPEKDRYGTAMHMVEVLRSNELITMAIETPVAPEDCQRAVPVDFLGRQMLLLPGSVGVAKITGSPVLLLVVHRLQDWRHQVVEISPPVSLDGDTVTVLKRFIKILEAPVRQNLAYWDWLANTQNLVDLGLLPAQMQCEGIQR
jgi:KDO2-lipid IV(A) lauroyltransferase